MATIDDVRRIATGLPQVEERQDRGEWVVRGKSFVWQRPLRHADHQALGDSAPAGTIVGIRVPEVGDQQALVQNGPDGVFITPHFEGWPAVLVELEKIGVEELAELIEDAWLVQAPKRVSKPWLESREPEESG